MPKLFSLSLALTLAFILSACSSIMAPSFKLPSFTLSSHSATPLPFVSPTVVGSWQAVSPSTAFAGTSWTETYPLPRLPEFLRQAEAENPTLQLVAARVKQARAIAGLALAAQLPAISASANATRSRLAPSQANRPAGTNVAITNSFGAGLNANFELDLFGRLAGEGKATRLEALSTESLQADAKLAISVEIARTYAALLAATKIESQWFAIMAAEEQRLAILTARYQAGELDVASWQSAAAALQQQRSLALAAAANTRQLHHALSVLLGQTPQTINLTGQDLASLNNIPPSPAAEISATVLLNRPDVRAAALQLQAANQRIGAARAAFLPQVNLNALGGFVSPIWGDVFEWNNRSWSVGPVVTLPIFQGGAILNNLRANWAEYEAQVALYKNTVLNAMADASDARITLTAAANQAASAQQAEQSMNTALIATQQRYQLGDIGRYELLTTQIAAAQSAIAAAQAQAGHHAQALRFIQSLGGTVPTTASSPQPTTQKAQ